MTNQQLSDALALLRLRGVVPDVPVQPVVPVDLPLPFSESPDVDE